MENRALLVDESDYGAQMFAGAIHLWKRDWEQAVRSFRNAAETKGNSTTLHSNLAAAYWGLGEQEQEYSRFEEGYQSGSIKRKRGFVFF